ncbi:MAG: pyridoxal-dependent decarboxylase [Candidatus Promineifilaceae bacterium]|nr:pyridoxal-dependent decarboxylase [Candidatus Promineifilaceae bacterium]
MKLEMKRPAVAVTACEHSLDPPDWHAARALAHRMVDDLFAYHESIGHRPVWQPVPDHVREALDQPLPAGPQAAEAVYEEFLDHVLPFGPGNGHPRFWGWVIGTGTVSGMLAEMLAAGMNAIVSGGDHAPLYVERQVVRWCAEMVGYPAGSGLLVSGASMANLVGLTVAREARAGWDVRLRGAHAGPPLAAYGSVEMHSSIEKAIRLLGMGADALRRLPVDAQYRINLDALQAAVRADRVAGLRPICVVGNAGTVNTGAVDDLTALADFCEREGLWFHVDGAFGALAALSPTLRPLVAGMARADSLAFDLHKWMHMPYEIGCVLLRDEAHHRRTFSLAADYLAPQSRGLAGGPVWFSEYGPQLSRSFRALKAWMGIKEHGIEQYRRQVEQNVTQAAYLAELVMRHPALELLAPVPLNVVCFRYRGRPRSRQLPPSADALDALNEELLLRLHESGVAVPSYTRIDGCYALRVAITNHRSRREDLELLVKEVVRLGDVLARAE